MVPLRPHLINSTNFSLTSSSCTTLALEGTYHSRPRTLIRTIILPILWHVGSIIYFTDDQLARLRPIIHNIVQNNTNTDLPSTSTPGQLNTLRHSVSPSLGGLGLPSVTATLLSIRLSLLIQALQQIRHSPGQVPHWFSPILQLFSATLQHAGLGLDILNIPTPRPVKLSYNNGAIYRLLGSTFLPSLLSQQRSPTQHLCQPIWLNKLLRYGPSRTSLMKAITISHHLFSQHIYRIIDFPAGPCGRLHQTPSVFFTTPKPNKSIKSSRHCSQSLTLSSPTIRLQDPFALYPRSPPWFL